MLRENREGGQRGWPRGQKFALSPAGSEAEEAYRAAVTMARASGRSALEAALAAWAEPRRLAPADGVILAQLSAKPLGLPHLCEALEPAGIEAADVKAGIRRLVDAGVVEPLPLASQLARQEQAAPPRTYRI